MTECWRVLLIGDSERSEFRDARTWLAAHTELQLAEHLQAAAINLKANTIPLPDAVVVCQTRPGQFSSDQIERLHQCVPLARLVALLGSLCEGEPRSGKPWPGVNRVYWYDWRPRFEQEFGREARSKAPTRWAPWELPRTATDVDSTLHAARWFKQPIPSAYVAPVEYHPLIAIRAQNGSTAEGLADACRSFGYRSLSIRGNEASWSSANVLLWDSESLDEPEASQLAVACQEMARQPVIALLGFPRSQDHQMAAAAGVAAVIAKPFQIQDLHWHLHALMPIKTFLRKHA